MRVGIIEADTTGREALAHDGSYADMVARWIGPALPGAAFRPIGAFRGEALPDDPAAYDAYLVTGSRYGVYERLPWMAPIESFLRRARDGGVPIGGICFGHQIMAHAFGAAVEKSPGGFVLGVECYRGKRAFAAHQDQVRTLPEGAAQVDGSGRCPIGWIGYEFPAISVQYHPEFDHGYYARMLDVYHEEFGEGAADRARTELDAALDRGAIARDFAEVLKGRAGAFSEAGGAAEHPG